MLSKKVTASWIKLLLIAASLAVFAGCALAEGFKIGIISAGSINDEAALTKNFQSAWEMAKSSETIRNSFAADHSNEDSYVYYDTLASLQLALDSGKVREIDVPQIVGEYMLAASPRYEISCTMTNLNVNIDFVFGFFDSEKGSELQKKFDEALAALRANGKLDELLKTYTGNFDAQKLQSAELENFDGAETLKIAVTGDMPPIDFVAADGKPAGFNVAILSEIAKILKVNLEFINVDTGAKTVALTSGRADVVFWYKKVNVSHVLQYDIPANVLISSPYYSFNTFVHVRLKDAK